MQYSKPHAGFTLLELLIYISIIALISCMAYPNFNAYHLQQHRQAALYALVHDQLNMERCYAQHADYTAKCSLIPPFPHRSIKDHYNISISKLTSSSYTLTVETRDKQCAVLSVNHLGLKTAVNAYGASAPECWKGF